MPGIRRTKVQRLKDREQIAGLLLRSHTLVRIAEITGLSYKTIQREVRVLEAEWRDAASADIAEVQVRELRRLEQIESEAWAEWERSKQDYEKRVSQSGGEGGGYDKTETGGRLGDPRYLQAALAAHERRCKLLGLDAPQKIAPTNPDGSALTTKEHRDAVVAAFVGETTSQP